MTGFISAQKFAGGGLGFVSGPGAFIGGMAKQANENIAGQEAEDSKNKAQENQLWIARSAKLDASVNDYNKQRDETRRKAGVYNTFKTLLGNDDNLATQGYHIWEGNGGKDKIEDIVRQINQSGNKNYQSPQGFTSDVIPGLQTNLQTQYNTLNDKLKAVPERFQGLSGTPLEPNILNTAVGDIGQQNQPLQQTSQTTPTSYTGPDQVISPGATNTQTPGTTNIPPSGTQQTANNTGIVLNPKEQTGREHLLPPSAFPDTPQGQEDFNKYLIQHGEQPVAGVHTGPTRVPKEQLPPSPGATAYESAVGKKYGTAVGTDVTKLSQDANTIISFIENGQLKTGAWQPWIDSVNSLLVPLGFDIHKYVNANEPMNADLARKAMTMIQADITTAAHFARVTNFEFNTMGKASPQLATNENANVYMALTLKKIAERMVDKQSYVLQQFNKDNRFDAYEAEKAGSAWDKTHMDTPAVPQINTKNMSHEQISKIWDTLSPGDYYVNMATGFLGKK